jgi:hypothetical protein
LLGVRARSGRQRPARLELEVAEHFGDHELAVALLVELEGFREVRVARLEPPDGALAQSREVLDDTDAAEEPAGDAVSAEP